MWLQPNSAPRFWYMIRWYMAFSLFRNTHPKLFKDGDSFQKYSSWWKSARLLIWAHKSLLTFRCYQEPAVLWSTCVTLKTNHEPISQPPRLLHFSLHVLFWAFLCYPESCAPATSGIANVRSRRRPHWQHFNALASVSNEYKCSNISNIQSMFYCSCISLCANVGMFAALQLRWTRPREHF